MTQKLHPRSVGSLEPRRDAVTGELRRAEYFDAEERGLSVRVTPDEARSYYWTYSIHGRTRRLRVGSVEAVTLAEAREKVRKLRARLELEGVDPAAERSEARRVARAGGELTVTRLLERCLAALELRPSTRTQWERLAQREIGPALGARAAASITRVDVRAMLAPIAARAPYVANRTFEVLRRAYTWGVREDLVPASPCTGLVKPAQEHASERVLSRVELRALLRALDSLGTGPYPDAVRLLLLTGVREGNVLGMRRGELALDGDAPRWVIPSGRMKAGQTHVVALVPQALAVVRRRVARADKRVEHARQRGRGGRSVGPAELTQLADLLFPAATGAIVPATWSSRFRAELRTEVNEHAKAMAEKGIDIKSPLERWTVHGLRHTLATHLREELRVPRDVVALILAHRPRGGSDATARYDRAELLDERRAALVAWAAWLDRLDGEGGARVLPLAPRDPRAGSDDEDDEDEAPTAPKTGRAKGGRSAHA